MDKNKIRKNMSAVRDAMTEKERKEKSKIMWQYLMESEEYQKADIIFTYVSVNSEAETTSFFEKIWRDGKKIAVPITEKNRKMDFVFLNCMEELTQQRWGIPEPDKQKSIITLPTNKSLFIVPALAVDKKGARIGYGGGYYDTYFSKVKDGFKMGFVFSVQKIQEIEVENTDILLDGIITEHGPRFLERKLSKEL